MDGPRGDEGFERLYEQHRRAVYRFVLGRVRDRQEAEDVTQAAFLDAFRALGRGDKPARPRPWLLAIAENVLRRRRRRDRVQEVPLDDFTEEARVAEVAATAAEIRAALELLPESQREVFLLREVHGRRAAETAEQLGLSVAAVEMLLFRARRSFRSHFEETRPPIITSVLLALRGLVPQFETGNLDAVKAVAAAAAVAVAAGAAGGSSSAAPRHPEGGLAPGIPPVAIRSARLGSNPVRQQREAPPRALWQEGESPSALLPEEDRDDAAPAAAPPSATSGRPAEKRVVPPAPKLPLQLPLAVPKVEVPAPAVTVTTPSVPAPLSP